MPVSMPMNSRDANPREQAAWNRIKSLYKNQLTPSVDRARQAGEDTFTLQRVFDAWGGVGVTVSSPASVKATQKLIERYNTIGRIIAGVDLGKYRLHFRGNEIDVLTNVGDQPDQYAPDQYLGAIPLIALVVGGAVLVTAIGAVIKWLDNDAKRIELEDKKITLEADREIISKGGATAIKWIEQKKQIADDAGWLAKVFGASTSKGIGAVMIGALVLGGLLLFSKNRKVGNG